MKKSAKISGSIMVVGLILLVVGLLNNGNQPVGANEFSTPWHTISGKSVTRTYKTGKFSQINLDLFMPDIHVHPGNGYRVTVSGPNAKSIRVKAANGELTVTDTNQHSFFGINWNNNLTARVDVTVPDRDALNKITGHGDEGDLDLKDLTIDQIDVRLDGGDATLANVKAHNIALELEEGDVRINNSALSSGSLTVNEGDTTIRGSKFKLAARSDEGDVTISASRLLGSSSFRVDEGDFDMTTDQRLGYDLSSTDDDDITLHGNDYEGSYHKAVTGAPTLKVECSEGDITID